MSLLTLEEKIKCLDNFLLDVSCLDELKKYKKNPNIFDVLKITKAEIRHSNILSWLLDVNENHKLNDTFIRFFINKVLSFNSCEHKMIENWSFLKFDDLKVIREWHPSKDSSLDILVLFKSDNKNFLIAIENKIDSKEHSDQTDKYKNHIDKEFSNYEKLFVFLSPFGDEPKNKDWNILTYGEILSILENNINLENSDNIVSVLIENYKEILKKYIMNDNDLIELCNKIYKEHKEALDLIFENKKDNASFVAEKLKKALNEISKEENSNIIFDEQFCSGSSYIRFATKSLNDYLRQSNEPNSTWNNNQRHFYEFHTYNLKTDSKLPLFLTLTKDNLDDEAQYKCDKICEKFNKSKSTTKTVRIKTKNIDNAVDVFETEEELTEFLKKFINNFIKETEDKILKN